jgi:hypothetical protein
LAGLVTAFVACGSSTGTTPIDAGLDGAADSGLPADSSSDQTPEDANQPADAGDSGQPADSSSAQDGGDAGSFCTGPVTEALIDDMTGSSISFTPPPCATPGAWTVGSGAPGFLTTPAGDAAVLENCGSLCGSLYSPLPSGFPGTVSAGDAGPAVYDAATYDAASDSAEGGDGAPLGPQALCIAGQTSPEQFYAAGMSLEFAFSGSVPDGGPSSPTEVSGFTTVPPPALIDASQYSGIQFWLWVSPDTATAVASSFEVQLFDENELPGGGKCDSSSTTAAACGAASADLSGSVASLSQGAGPLFDADGGVLTSLAGGWQLIQAPWSSFTPNTYYGGANENVVDPSTLAFLQFLVQQDSSSGPAISFDFCVYQVAFYP